MDFLAWNPLKEKSRQQTNTRKPTKQTKHRTSYPVPHAFSSELDGKTFKQVHGIEIGIKFATPYAILFIADLEEKILSASEGNPMIWWRYIDDIFFIWEHEEKSLEKFLNKLNNFHSTIKLTAEYSIETINFLVVR